MKKKAIVVVGMHRSGTSAVSGLLDELGVFMGKNLFAPQENVNEKGFFENAKVVNINDLLFDALLGSWDDPLSYNFDLTYPDAYSSLESTTQKFLSKEYASYELWGMKDPRTSLHLPFWDKMITNSNTSPCYLMMLRNPLEVVASIVKRDEFSMKKALLLWINYTLSSYLFCASKSLYILNFDSLLASPENVLIAICKKFNIDMPKKESTFIEAKLRNHVNNNDNEKKDELMNLACELYAELSRPVVDNEKIEGIKNQYINYIKQFDELFKEHLQSVKKDEVYYRTLFYKAYSSIWWKISWPLRKLEKTLSKN
tara:strand:+ start:1424 stop:2362 length:939 start_codon:yes stop_codon:yes gene_type:complete